MTTDVFIEELINETELKCTAEQFRARAALQKLAAAFPDTSEGRLWLAVVGMAVLDTLLPTGTDGRKDYQAITAERYLDTPVIPACEISGVDSAYVRRIINETLEKTSNVR